MSSEAKALPVDVIIPTYKPGRDFLDLMDALIGQTMPPARIIIMNTGAEYFAKLMAERDFTAKYDTSVIFHHDEGEFDHGGTRNRAAAIGKAGCFVMMTQDAVPADRHLLEHLRAGLGTDGRTAVCYGRQVATERSDALEHFIRSYNYGDEPQEKSWEDVGRMGIKAFFCSNVCAMYDRRIFAELGGFATPTIFNEDMIYAALALRSGYIVRYEPKARVRHAHDYTYREQRRRNFDIGVSHAEYPQVFADLATEAEGRRMVMAAARHLLATGHPLLLPKLLRQSLAKYRGFAAGRNYAKLPLATILKKTSQPHYWKSRQNQQGNQLPQKEET